MLEIGDRSWPAPKARRAGRGHRRAPRRHRDPGLRGRGRALSSAESAGVGVRVIVDDRQGFAYAGTLDDDVLAEVLAEARDNAALRHARRVPRPRRARRRRAGSSSTCGATTLADVPDRRQGRRWPSSSSGPCTAADPRITGRRVGRVRRRAWPRPRVVTTDRHPGRRAGRPPATCRAYAMATEGDETQTGFGFSVGREPGDLDVEACRRRRRRAGHPPARRHQAGQRRGSRSCSTRASPPSSSASVGGTLSGEAVLKGRSLFADRIGEEVGVAAAHAGRRPHQPAGLSAPPRPTARGWPPGATPLHRRAACCRASCTTPTPAAASGTALDRLGGAGLHVDARRRLPGAGARARRPAPGRAHRRHRRRRARPVGRRPALGRQPGQRRLLDRRRGAAHPRRRAGRAACGSSRSPRPSSGCCKDVRPSAATSSGCRWAPPASASSSTT